MVASRSYFMPLNGGDARNSGSALNFTFEARKWKFHLKTMARKRWREMRRFIESNVFTCIDEELSTRKQIEREVCCRINAGVNGNASIRGHLSLNLACKTFNKFL